jgi:hypothetical protein
MSMRQHFLRLIIPPRYPRVYKNAPRPEPIAAASPCRSFDQKEDSTRRASHSPRRSSRPCVSVSRYKTSCYLFAMTTPFALGDAVLTVIAPSTSDLLFGVGCLQRDITGWDWRIGQRQARCGRRGGRTATRNRDAWEPAKTSRYGEGASGVSPALCWQISEQSPSDELLSCLTFC